VNPNSLEVLAQAWVEPGLAVLPLGQTVQFERLGYFCHEPNPHPASKSSTLIFNRTLGLRDSWAKIKGNS
jgi:glutaminyl-tRNA synthetase